MRMVLLHTNALHRSSIHNSVHVTYYGQRRQLRKPPHARTAIALTGLDVHYHHVMRDDIITNVTAKAEMTSSDIRKVVPNSYL